MNELKQIKDGLNKHGRVAYEKAKSAGNAVILKGNSICSVGKDGKEVVISKVTCCLFLRVVSNVRHHWRF